MYKRDAFFIDGGWRDPDSGDRHEVVSPTTEEVVGLVPLATEKDVDTAVSAARRAFDHGPWPTMSMTERIFMLEGMVEALRPRLDELVEIQVDEMGGAKSYLLPATRGVIDGFAGVAEIARRIKLRDLREGGYGKVIVTRDPVGVVGAIIPWNAPIGLIFNKIVPALLTGCAVVVKPPPESPLSAYLVAEAAMEAALPDGILNIVAGDRAAGERLVRNADVDHVTFTGSSQAGMRVAGLCGERLAGATLELGGKSAAIVLPDVDLDQTLPQLIESSLPNTGQVCYATSRVLLPRERAEEITHRLVEAVGALKVGDPHEVDTVFGPLAASRQRDRVETFIRSGVEEGAEIVLGGGRPPGIDRGWFVKPTIFRKVDNAMTIAREEIFGPVLCLIEYDDIESAVRIANDSEYGLGGAVYTTDVEVGVEIATRVHTGSCRVNGGLGGGGGGPFGGVKRSGLGRERGPEGFDSYFELKSITLP